MTVYRTLSQNLTAFRATTSLDENLTLMVAYISTLSLICGGNDGFETLQFLTQTVCMRTYVRLAETRLLVMITQLRMETWSQGDFFDQPVDEANEIAYHQLMNRGALLWQQRLLTNIGNLFEFTNQKLWLLASETYPGMQTGNLNQDRYDTKLLKDILQQVQTCFTGCMLTFNKWKEDQSRSVSTSPQRQHYTPFTRLVGQGYVAERACVSQNRAVKSMAPLKARLTLGTGGPSGG